MLINARAINSVLFAGLFSWAV